MAKEEILERLVALHDQRVAEEKSGVIRWLRLEYQILRFALQHLAEPDLPAGEAAASEEAAPTALMPRPARAVEQLAGPQALFVKAPLTVEEAVAAPIWVDWKLVGRHLETLAMLGEAREVARVLGGRSDQLPSSLTPFNRTTTSLGAAP